MAEHWFRAALWHHRETSWIYEPLSNLDGTEPRRVGQGTINSYGMYDIAGNVREWCINPADSGRLTLGGGWEDAEFLVRYLSPKLEFDRSPSDGFRLVAVTDHDSTIAHLSGRIVRPVPRDFRTPRRSPTSNSRSIAACSATTRCRSRPAATLEARAACSDGERVSFSAA